VGPIEVNATCDPAPTCSRRRGREGPEAVSRLVTQRDLAHQARPPPARNPNEYACRIACHRTRRRRTAKATWSIPRTCDMDGSLTALTKCGPGGERAVYSGTRLSEQSCGRAYRRTSWAQTRSTTRFPFQNPNLLPAGSTASGFA
jgi:hypothetical protein